MFSISPLRWNSEGLVFFFFRVSWEGYTFPRGVGFSLQSSENLPVSFMLDSFVSFFFWLVVLVHYIFYSALWYPQFHSLSFYLLELLVFSQNFSVLLFWYAGDDEGNTWCMRSPCAPTIPSNIFPLWEALCNGNRDLKSAKSNIFLTLLFLPCSPNCPNFHWSTVFRRITWENYCKAK